MLTLPEKILFVLAVLASLYAAYRAASRIVGTIRRGQGKIDWDIPKKRIGSVLAKTITLQPVFRLRFWPSLFHGFVAWGFIYLPAGQPGGCAAKASSPASHSWARACWATCTACWRPAERGRAGRHGRPDHPALPAQAADADHAPGCAAAARRRAAASAATRPSWPALSCCMSGSRFLGQSFKLALHGGDPWQPFASAVSGAVGGLEPGGADRARAPHLLAGAGHHPGSSSPISCIPSTSTCSLPRSTSCSSRSAARSAS